MIPFLNHELKCWFTRFFYYYYFCLADFLWLLLGTRLAEKQIQKIKPCSSLHGLLKTWFTKAARIPDCFLVHSPNPWKLGTNPALPAGFSSAFHSALVAAVRDGRGCSAWNPCRGPPLARDKVHWQNWGWGNCALPTRTNRGLNSLGCLHILFPSNKFILHKKKK